MSTDLMMRHAQLAGLPGSGKAMAASLLTRPGDDEPTAGRVDRDPDSRSHNPVVAANGTAASDREVTG